MVDPSVNPYYQRLSQNPEDAEALFVLWQWYGDRGEFQQLAALAEQVAARRLDPSSAADLFYRAGELWAKNVGRVDKAVGNYRRAFELDSNQMQAVEAARAIYVQLGNHKLAAQLYERQLAATAEPHERLTLLRELANMRAQLNDAVGQIAPLEEILQITPDDFEALRELAAAYIARSQGPGGSEQDTMRAAVLLATIAQGLGGEHTIAFAEAALDAWPGEETAYSLIEEAYTRAGRSDDLALRQIQFLGANPNSALAVPIRKTLGALYADAGQFDDAIEALSPLAGHDADATRSLVGLYRQAGRGAELLQLLASLPPSRDSGQRVSDLREIAELQGQQGHRDAMVQALREILTFDPTDAEALAVVDDDCRARNAYDELRQILYASSRAPSCPADAKKGQLREIALISEQRLNDANGAIEAWRAFLALEGDNDEGQQAIERLFTRAERWDDLARWLEKRGEGETDPAAARVLWDRLATLHRAQRNEPAAEAAALTNLWQLDAEDDAVAQRLIDARRRADDDIGAAEVMRARAEAATGPSAVERWVELSTHLEACDEKDDAIQAWQKVNEIDPRRPDAWEGVERLLEATGRLDLLVETLIANADAVDRGPASAALRVRASEVARSLGDTKTATDQAQRALEEQPDDDAVAGMLMDAYDAAGETEKLIELLRDRAGRAKDIDAKLGHLRRLANTLGKSSPEAAAKVWNELREVAKKSDKRDDAEALDALIGFAEVSGETETLAGLLREAAAFASEPAQKRDLLVRRAELLAGELNQLEAAFDTLQDVTKSIDSSHAPTWAVLAEFSEKLGRWESVADALEHQLDALPEEDESKTAIAARLVAVCDDQLKDAVRTLGALERQYDADPTDYAIVTKLAERCEQQERWADAIKYLEVLAEIEGDEAELSAMVQRIAEMAEQKLGSPRKAFDTLAPQAKEGDIASLEALRGVAERGKLEGDLIPVLAGLAARVGDMDTRADLWTEVAQRNEKALRDKSAALDAHMKSLVAVAGRSTTLDAIDRLASELKATDRANEAYRAAVAASSDPTAIRDVALRGATFLKKMNAAELAFDLLMSAQQRAAGEEAILDGIVEMAAPAGRREEMYIAFDRRKNATKDEGERYRLLLRAAEAAAVALGDKENALTYMQQAVQQAIGGKQPDEERLERIEKLARDVDTKSPETNLRTALVEQYAGILEEQGEDIPRAASVLARRGGVMCEKDLEAPDHAYMLFTRAVTLWPGDAAGPETLEVFARATKRVADVVNLYQKVIDDAYDATTARMYQARRATLLGDVLGRVDEAIEALRGLIEIAPKDIEALRMLQSLLRKHKKWQDLLMALERELEVGTTDRLAVLKEIATVWEKNLRNAFEAKDAWKRVLAAKAGDSDAQEGLDRLARKRSSDEPDDEPPPEEIDEAPPAEAEPPTGEAEAVESLDDAEIMDAASRELRAPPSDLSLLDDGPATEHARPDVPQPVEPEPLEPLAEPAEPIETTGEFEEPPTETAPVESETAMEPETADAPAASELADAADVPEAHAADADDAEHTYVADAPVDHGADAEPGIGGDDVPPRTAMDAALEETADDGLHGVRLSPSPRPTLLADPAAGEPEENANDGLTEIGTGEILAPDALDALDHLDAAPPRAIAPAMRSADVEDAGDMLEADEIDAAPEPDSLDALSNMAAAPPAPPRRSLAPPPPPPAARKSGPPKRK